MQQIRIPLTSRARCSLSTVLSSTLPPSNPAGSHARGSVPLEFEPAHGTHARQTPQTTTSKYDIYLVKNCVARTMRTHRNTNKIHIFCSYTSTEVNECEMPHSFTKYEQWAPRNCKLYITFDHTEFLRPASSHMGHKGKPRLTRCCPLHKSIFNTCDSARDFLQNGLSNWEDLTASARRHVLSIAR